MAIIKNMKIFPTKKTKEQIEKDIMLVEMLKKYQRKAKGKIIRHTEEIARLDEVSYSIKEVLEFPIPESPIKRVHAVITAGVILASPEYFKEYLPTEKGKVRKDLLSLSVIELENEQGGKIKIGSLYFDKAFPTKGEINMLEFNGELTE